MCYTAVFHKFCQDPANLSSLLQYYRVTFVLFALQVAAIIYFPRQQALLFAGFVL